MTLDYLDEERLRLLRAAVPAGRRVLMAPVPDTGLLGGLYLVSALVLGAIFVGFAVMLERRAEDRLALRTYLFSLAYLALLFIAMAVDAIA